MTKKYAMVLGIGVALAAGAGVLSLRGEETPAAPDVKKLADQVGKKGWDELSKEGETVAKKHDDLRVIMQVFKPRKKDAEVSGVGVGDKPGAILPDGIEQKLIRMAGRAGVTGADMAKAPALKRMSAIAAAVAAATVHKPSKDAQKTKEDTRKWREYSKEMHDASLDLIKALDERSRPKAKAAAEKLHDACTKCHSDYRKDAD